MRAGSGPPPGFSGMAAGGATPPPPPPTNLTQHQLFESLQVGHLLLAFATDKHKSQVYSNDAQDITKIF
jgi:hypothetical protein